MNPVIRRLAIIFLGVFVVINAALLVYHFGWEVPRDRCLTQRKWWDGSERVCAQPILTSDVTGRLITNPKAREEALKAIGRAPAATPGAAPAPAKP